MHLNLVCIIPTGTTDPANYTSKSATVDKVKALPSHQVAVDTTNTVSPSIFHENNELHPLVVPHSANDGIKSDRVVVMQVNDLVGSNTHIHTHTHAHLYVHTHMCTHTLTNTCTHAHLLRYLLSLADMHI